MKKIDWKRDDDGHGHIVLSAQCGPVKLFVANNGDSPPPHSHLKPGMWSWSSRGLGTSVADNVVGQSDTEAAALADISDAVELKIHQILILQRRSLAELSELVEPAQEAPAAPPENVTILHAPCACGWKPPRAVYLSLCPPSAVRDLAYGCPECGSRVNKSP